MGWTVLAVTKGMTHSCTETQETEMALEIDGEKLNLISSISAARYSKHTQTTEIYWEGG